MQAKDLAGVQVGGREPKALLLSDGSRLALEEDAGPRGRADWTLVGAEGDDTDGLTVADAIGIAGEEYADYVKVRTRAEVAWLEVVSEWYREQAERLSR